MHQFESKLKNPNNREIALYKFLQAMHVTVSTGLHTLNYVFFFLFLIRGEEIYRPCREYCNNTNTDIEPHAVTLFNMFNSK